MSRELVPDARWARLRRLLPPLPPQPRGGRPWKSHLACLRGILFVLHTGIQWEALPAEAFGVSGKAGTRHHILTDRNGLHARAAAALPAPHHAL
jgi:transposase